MFLCSLYCKLFEPNITKTVDPVLVIVSMALVNLEKLAIIAYFVLY